VWVSAGDDDHAELAAAGDQFTERITVRQPGAAMVERNVRRVIGDTPAGAETDGVGPGAFEVIEPELRVESSGVVFDERELELLIGGMSDIDVYVPIAPTSFVGGF